MMKNAKGIKREKLFRRTKKQARFLSLKNHHAVSYRTRIVQLVIRYSSHYTKSATCYCLCGTVVYASSDSPRHQQMPLPDPKQIQYKDPYRTRVPVVLSSVLGQVNSFLCHFLEKNIIFDVLSAFEKIVLLLIRIPSSLT